MERVLKAFLFSIVSSAAVAAIGAQSQASQRPPNAGEGNELLRCIYTPQADSQSSSLPTKSLGFKFQLQRNNSNHIAVDGYTLNDSKQLIKQVSHAELVGAVSEISATTKATDIIASLTLAEDSPFDFAVTLDTANIADGRFSAVVESVAMFTGETYTQVPVNCRIAPEQKQQQQLTQKAP
ncbi:MAG: hypothetical protein J7501_11495 [Bdellovibrio sp.]|nr:hypothetical protein [Bdellovibrio sp.]